MTVPERLPLPPANVLRPGVASLGLPQLALGIWAIFWPRGFYDSFPVIAGQHWLPAYGAYDSHLATDVGSTFAAIGILMLVAAWIGELRVMRVALVAYLVYAIPHTVYHLANDHVLSSGSQVVNGALLVSTVLGGIGFLLLTFRAAEPAPDSTKLR